MGLPHLSVTGSATCSRALPSSVPQTQVLMLGLSLLGVWNSVVAVYLGMEHNLFRDRLTTAKYSDCKSLLQKGF